MLHATYSLECMHFDPRVVGLFAPSTVNRGAVERGTRMKGACMYEGTLWYDHLFAKRSSNIQPVNSFSRFVLNAERSSGLNAASTELT